MLLLWITACTAQSKNGFDLTGSLVPPSEILSGANNSRGPYETYLKSPQIMFPVSAVSKRYHPKEEVLGLSIDGVPKAYPFVELYKGPATFADTVGGKTVTVRYERRHRSAEAFDEHGERLSGVRTFWFAWHAFNPDTEIYTAPKTQ